MAKSIYSVAVGNVNPLSKEDRNAVKFICKLEGLYGVHPSYPTGTLILFNTLNDAKGARNRMEAAEIKCGKNICRYEIAADGAPVFKEVC